MLITITSPVGIFNVSDVKPELKATENIFFETLPNVNYISNDSINDLVHMTEKWCACSAPSVYL